MPTTITKTVKPSGGNYTKLNDAVQYFKDNYANFVTSDIIGEIQIDGTWSSPDTTTVRFTGLTTNATNYLWIHTMPAARHAGVWSTAKYVLGITSADPFWCSDATDVHIDGLQISLTTTSDSGDAAIAMDAGNILLTNTLVKGVFSGTATNCNAIDMNDGTLVMYNCVFYNWIRGTASFYAILVDNAALHITAYNCVFANCYHGIRVVNGTGVFKNCYSDGNATECWWGTNMTLTNCASSDATGTAAALRNIIRSVTADSTHAGFTNVTAGTEDFHLVSSSSPLYHTGVDTSGDAAPLNFTTDIDGDTYPTLRSIGVDDGPAVSYAPTVTTTTPTNVGSIDALSGGNVTSDGGATITARGICWSTSANPTTADSHTAESGTTGSFTSQATSLSPVTGYHVRAYATNSVGTSYGADDQITTTRYRVIPTATMDSMLGVLSAATRLFVCSTQPTTYAEASTTYNLATQTLTGGDFSLAAGDTSGRKVTLAQKTGISISTGGTALHYALGISASSTLLVVGTTTSQALSQGGTFTFPQTDIDEIRDWS